MRNKTSNYMQRLTKEAAIGVCKVLIHGGIYSLGKVIAKVSDILFKSTLLPSVPIVKDYKPHENSVMSII